MAVNAAYSNGADQAQANNQSPSIQQVINQLIFFELGGETNAKDAQMQIGKLMQELKQLVNTLPKGEAQSLNSLLGKMPTNTESEAYLGELKGFFAQTLGLLGSNVKGGFSSQEFQNLLDQMPTNTQSESYQEEMNTWGAQVAAFVGTHLPNEVPKSMQQELQDIMKKIPTDTSSEEYGDDMMKFMAQLEMFMVSALPNSLSSSQKAELQKIESAIQNVDPSSEGAHQALEKLESQFQGEISQDLFS